MKLPEQVQYVKGQRRTSINRDALEKLGIFFHAKPICNTIIRIRDLGKKVSVLRSEIDADSRMRTSYNVAGPETGRWSSSSNVYGGGTNYRTLQRNLDGCSLQIRATSSPTSIFPRPNRVASLSFAILCLAALAIWTLASLGIYILWQRL